MVLSHKAGLGTGWTGATRELAQQAAVDRPEAEQWDRKPFITSGAACWQLEKVHPATSHPPKEKSASRRFKILLIHTVGLHSTYTLKTEGAFRLPSQLKQDTIGPVSRTVSAAANLEFLQGCKHVDIKTQQVQLLSLPHLCTVTLLRVRGP